MFNFKTILVALLGCGLVAISLANNEEFFFDKTQTKVHKNLPGGITDYFAGSGKCMGCHGYDPQQIASVDLDTNDVNVVDAWRSSIMANSAKDPFWRAKVAHEKLENPAHQVDIEDKCTSCHAPLGHFEAKLKGQSHYTLSEMDQDSVALDGVSCSACHQLDPNFVGLEFSGNLSYDTNKVVFGKVVNPFSAPMQSFVGFNVVYEPKVSESEYCAGCHTLLTKTVDLSGNYTGDEFPEQATYQEYQNSDYSSGPGLRHCQSCHMPRIDDPIILAIDYSFIGGRTPFGQHTMTGPNAFMLGVFKNNIDSLGLNADSMQFAKSLELSLNMLQDSAVNLGLNELNRTVDTVFYAVSLENLGGHKLPSGYPSRRMFLQFVVLDSIGDTLFQSGTWDNNFEVNGHDPIYEQHYQTIRANDEVQIYEMVMADVSGDKTTVLERGNSLIKDNRIPPKGFTTAHIAYDTTKIAGNALLDNDFNTASGLEGTGADIVHYNVNLNGYMGNLNTIARVYYQSAPPGWMTEMFAFSDYYIDRFKTMYDNADRAPILMKEIKDGDIFTSIPLAVKSKDWSVYPNPSNGTFKLSGLDRNDVESLNIYSLSGALIHEQKGGVNMIQLNVPPATYILQVIHKNGNVRVKRVVVI